MERQLAELRGNVDMLQASLERATADGTLKPAREAMIRKKIARTKFRIWVTALDNSLIPDLQAAYAAALAFPSNESQALMWWELARVYIMYGAYDGGLKVFDRIMLDFATFERISLVMMSHAGALRRQRKYLDAANTLLTVMRKGTPAPYTFTDIMLHIAWCYELHGDWANDDFYRKEAREGFAAAFMSTDNQVSDAVRMFGQGNSLTKTWEAWRMSSMTWLRLGRRHSEQQHVILAGDVFNEATRLRLIREQLPAAVEEDPVMARMAAEETAGERRSRMRKERMEEERRMAEELDSEFSDEEEESEEEDSDAEPVRPPAPTRAPSTVAMAKLKGRAGAGAGKPPTIVSKGPKPGTGPVYISSDSGTDLDSEDDMSELSLTSYEIRERDEKAAEEEGKKMMWEDINVLHDAPIPPVDVPPTMRTHPPSLPQPASKWDKQVTWDDDARAALPKRVARKSAVEEATLWMFATDAFLRSDQNEAAHQAAQAAIKGAAIGDVTSSAALAVLSKSDTELGNLLQSRAASHLMFLSMRWIGRVRLRMKRRRASGLIGRSWRQYRYRKRFYARLMVQSRCKGWLYWLKYTRLRRATFPVQCWWRMLLCMWTKRRLMRTRLRWALLLTQRNVRMWINREQYARWLTAAIRIQRYFRGFMDRLRAFMWERYHLYAAQELEHWKGTNIGCTVIPKKFVRQYDSTHRIPVQRSVLASHDFLPALSTLALDGSLAATSGPLSVSVGAGPSFEDSMADSTLPSMSSSMHTSGQFSSRSGTGAGKPKTVMLHPHDRIIQSRVIPTRIEMLAEEVIWGRADDIAENIAFADVNAQQGAIWGYNDGEQEIADWGGYYTLYKQVHGIKRGKGRAGKRFVFGPKHGRRPGGARRDSEADIPLEFPGVDVLRGWMKGLEEGELPSWNRGVGAMWDVFLSGKGTKYFGPNRELYNYRSPHTCAEPMHACDVPDAVLAQAAAVGLATSSSVHRHRQHGTTAASKFLSRDLDRNAERAETALTTLQTSRPWSRGKAKDAVDIARKFPGADRAYQPGARRMEGVLTPTAAVRVGWCPQFVFEWAGRWGCDLLNWTFGMERNVWDLSLWLATDTWGFPYGSYEFFLVYQRWLADLPTEVRLWAKKCLDWRSMLEEQLQTAFRFSSRSYMDALRGCACRKVYNEDTTGWYAGWVPRYRHGRVGGAVPPAVDDGDADSDDGGAGSGTDLAASLGASAYLPLVVTKRSKVALPPAAGAGARSKPPPGGSKRRTRTRRPKSASSTGPSPSARAASKRLGRQPSSPAVVPATAAAAPPPAWQVTKYQDPLVVRNEQANALVVRYVMAEYKDQPVNRGTLAGDWVSEGLAELISAVNSARGMLGPTLAALKRRTVRWYTMQGTAEDNDDLRLRAHEVHVKAAWEERSRRAEAVRDNRNRTMQEPAVRMLAYRKARDGTQMFKLYKELIQKEVKRRQWRDVVELLQACAEEPLIQQTPVYLKSAVSFALKQAANVVQNKGLDSDATKFAEAKPRSFPDGGRGNPDEIGQIIKVETGGGDFPASALAVTAIGWSAQHGIKLERDTLCDALRTTTVPGGWKDAMYVYKVLKKSGFSMAAPVFDIMSMVCQNTYGKERPQLYEALKSAGASYALCFAAATMKGI